jgi:hypothetical protein
MSASGFVIAFLGVWLVGVTIAIFKIWKFFNLLSKDVHTENLEKLLEKVFQKEKEHSETIARFAKEIAHFQDQELIHMQKYGFVRFNPFGDMGGDHSFCLALLNGKNTGFVLTGLHTRERTRIYVKHIKRGKSEYDLSKEEKKALIEALQNRV